MDSVVVLGNGSEALAAALRSRLPVVDMSTERAIYVAFPGALPGVLSHTASHPGRIAGLMIIREASGEDEPGPEVACPLQSISLDRPEAMADAVVRFAARLPIEWSRREHRGMEAHLDRLQAALREGLAWREHFHRAWHAGRAHYLREDEEVFRPKADWPPARKMMMQHEEASEFGRTLAATNDADAERLARRYWAISQHNIIEEERDVFPYLT
ncbi:MAG: hypothetical protein IT160_05870 [Bryobacterales bacterium]|nr:hypothetical protein [Bryobacterales bacterium]